MAKNTQKNDEKSGAVETPIEPGSDRENKLFQLYLARITATDTYRTTEKAETRFRRCIGEAEIAFRLWENREFEK